MIFQLTADFKAWKIMTELLVLWDMPKILQNFLCRGNDEKWNWEDREMLFQDMRCELRPLLLWKRKTYFRCILTALHSGHSRPIHSGENKKHLNHNTEHVWKILHRIWILATESPCIHQISSDLFPVGKGYPSEYPKRKTFSNGFFWFQKKDTLLMAKIRLTSWGW